MSERWVYGDVIRVNPVTSPNIHQPDDRRWMVVIPAATGRQWTLFFLGNPTGSSAWSPLVGVSHWNTVFGFIRVEPEE